MMDAELLRPGFGSANADLLFTRMSGVGNGLTFEQFLDAMVEVAVLKYTDASDAASAVLRLYLDTLTAFSPPQDPLAYVTATTASIELIHAYHPSLYIMYQVYFMGELNDKFARTLHDLECISLRGFISLLEDFEVRDRVLSKGDILRVYRTTLKSSMDVELDFPNFGRFFTYHHVLSALLRVSQQVTSDDTTTPLLGQLFQRMDASRGMARARLKCSGGVRVPDRFSPRTKPKQSGQVYREEVPRTVLSPIAPHLTRTLVWSSIDLGLYN
jgi:hypothetical protein